MEIEHITLDFEDLTMILCNFEILSLDIEDLTTEIED